jgi:hypothetical protein
MHCGAFLDYGSVATTAEAEVPDSKSSKNETPKTVSESVSDVPDSPPRYDDSYDKNYLAVVVGAGLMILNTTLIFNGFFIENSVAAVTINMIWRIVAAVWITYIAKEQNREGFGWGLFGFLLPNLALIVIGLQRKLFKPSSHFDEVNHRQQEVQKEKDSSKLCTKDEIQQYDKAELELYEYDNGIKIWQKEQDPRIGDKVLGIEDGDIQITNSNGDMVTIKVRESNVYDFDTNTNRSDAMILLIVIITAILIISFVMATELSY